MAYNENTLHFALLNHAKKVGLQFVEMIQKLKMVLRLVVEKTVPWNNQIIYYNLLDSLFLSPPTSRLLGATVARLTPDQKVACSNHVGVNCFIWFQHRHYAGCLQNKMTAHHCRETENYRQYLTLHKLCIMRRWIDICSLRIAHEGK